MPYSRQMVVTRAPSSIAVMIFSKIAGVSLRFRPALISVGVSWSRTTSSGMTWAVERVRWPDSIGLEHNFLLRKNLQRLSEV
jgi:hypothetical protein